MYIFRKKINEEKVLSIDVDSSKKVNAFAYNKYLAILDQNELKIYNKSGNLEQSLEIEISNPLVETKGEYLCIAEKNGQKLYLICNKNIVWQRDIEGNISTINVNKNGYVSITISGTSYKTVIQTYSSSGDELFKNYLGTTNVIDSDISNDNKYLAIAEVNFSGIVVQSNIKIISMDDARNKPKESIKYSHISKANDLIINVNFDSEDNLICMYDEHIDMFKDGINTELIKFTNEEMLFADINLSSNIVKIINVSDGFLDSKVEMQIISNNNINDINKYIIDGIPKKIYTKDNKIAINLGTSVLFINDNGWLVKEYQSSRDEIQNIVMCDQIAGIIAKDKIYIVEL